MGGKSYFCDYCDCFMRNDVNVRKTHNDGKLHRMNKIRYMKKYEDPRKVYEEEVVKAPCSHFLKGRCRYDLLCQNSHFTSKQLQQLKQLVDNLTIKERKQRLSVVTTSNATSIQDVLPWKHMDRVRTKRLLKKSKNLPPSLKPIKLKNFAKVMDLNNGWGC